MLDSIMPLSIVSYARFLFHVMPDSVMHDSVMPDSSLLLCQIPDSNFHVMPDSVMQISVIPLSTFLL